MTSHLKINTTLFSDPLKTPLTLLLDTDPRLELIQARILIHPSRWSLWF